MAETLVAAREAQRVAPGPAVPDAPPVLTLDNPSFPRPP